MFTSNRFSDRLLPIAFLAAALVVVAACGEKKQPAEENGPTPSTPARPVDKAAAQSSASPAAREMPPSGKIDPLAGAWEVVKAEGQYADQNTGIVWSFGEGGKAFSVAMVAPDAKGRSELPVSTMGTVEKRTDWSWKRVGPDSIELSHAKSDIAANIRHRMEGEQLVLDWNSGGQILYLVKKK